MHAKFGSKMIKSWTHKWKQNNSSHCCKSYPRSILFWNPIYYQWLLQSWVVKRVVTLYYLQNCFTFRFVKYQKDYNNGAKKQISHPVLCHTIFNAKCTNKIGFTNADVKIWSFIVLIFIYFLKNPLVVTCFWFFDEFMVVNCKLFPFDFHVTTHHGCIPSILGICGIFFCKFFYSARNIFLKSLKRIKRKLLTQQNS